MNSMSAKKPVLSARPLIMPSGPNRKHQGLILLVLLRKPHNMIPELDVWTCPVTTEAERIQIYERVKFVSSHEECSEGTMSSSSHDIEDLYIHDYP